MHEGKVKSKIEFIHIRGLFMSSKVEVLIVLFVWSNFCCNRNFNRNFLLCLLLIFASSFMDRYILQSALLRKSNIDELQMLNYYLRQAEKKSKHQKQTQQKISVIISVAKINCRKHIKTPITDMNCKIKWSAGFEPLALESEV